MLSIDEEESSSSEDSIVQELDSDFENEPNVDYTGFSAKYMEEITSLLGAHSEVNCENALQINQEMQQRLHEVRKRLQTLLQAVQQRYLSNEQRLKLNMGKKKRGFGIRGAYLKGGTFFFKGNMFFKDLNCRNCPNNQDYEYRKNVEGEMFPMDFELCSRHVWSLLDKKAVVQAVKEQAIDYLADCKFRDKNNKSENLTLQIKVHTEKLSNLLTKVDDKFEIDWEQVSAHNLNYRHSPSSCKAMWLVYLHPSLKRSAWSVEENKQLLQAAQLHNYQKWESIAKAVGKRSDYQCFIQYQTCVCFMDTQRWGRWDKRDDTKLLQLIEKKSMNGVIDWNAVAAYFPRKPKKSLHQRYAYYLDPKLSHEPFTPEEDLILLAAVEEYGEKFALFPRTLFPNRSIIQLRMRYRNTLQSRHKLAPWTVDDDRKLMEFVSEHGTSAWLRCAEKLGNHNRISCRTRFLTIQKFFAKNPEAVLEDIPRKKTCVMKNSVITTQNWMEKVAELRENPDTVLVPPNRKETKIREHHKKSQKKIKKIESQIEALPKCDIQTRGTKKRKKRKFLYVERLRAVEHKIYNFFKYAYNFRLGTDVCTKPPNTILRTMATWLDFRPDPTLPYVVDELLSPNIGRSCKYLLWQQNTPVSDNGTYCQTLPPSWSTAMAFRALCVQAAQKQLENSIEEKVIVDNKPNEIEKYVALQRFRKRMHTLFYQTALLSRLQPSRFRELAQSTSSTVTAAESTMTVYSAEDTITSAYETLAEKSEFDLARVKDEYPSEYETNVEVVEQIASDREPIAKPLRTQKKVQRKSKTVARKRKLQTAPATTVLSEIVSAVNEQAENVVYEITYIGNSTLGPLKPDVPLQTDTSISVVSQSLPKTCIPPSEAEPPEKRFGVDAASCNKTDFKLTNIKTEFEL